MAFHKMPQATSASKSSREASNMQTLNGPSMRVMLRQPLAQLLPSHSFSPFARSSPRGGTDLPCAKAPSGVSQKIGTGKSWSSVGFPGIAEATPNFQNDGPPLAFFFLFKKANRWKGPPILRNSHARWGQSYFQQLCPSNHCSGGDGLLPDHHLAVSSQLV